MTDLAYEAGRRNTQAFINANPAPAIIKRKSRSDDGMGGTVTGAPATLSTQPTVRMCPANQFGNPVPRTTEDGSTVRPDWWVVAMPGTDIRKGDMVTADGHTVEVVHVSESPRWRQNCEGIGRG